MRASVRTGAGSSSTMAAFVVGLPLGLGLVWALTEGPWQQLLVAYDVDCKRYLHHPVEKVELVMFCCAIAALLAKLLAWFRERFAFHAEILPAWDGTAVPPAQAANLAAAN